MHLALDEGECVTWWQRLFELLSLLLVCDDECVQISAAAHLKLHIVLVLLDLNSFTHTLYITCNSVMNEIKSRIHSH